MRTFFAALAVVAVMVATAGCGGTSKPCVGTVTDKFTTFHQGYVSNGYSYGSGTSYKLGIKRADESVCAKGVKQDVWLRTKVGSNFTG